MDKMLYLHTVASSVVKYETKNNHMTDMTTLQKMEWAHWFKPLLCNQNYLGYSLKYEVMILPWFPHPYCNISLWLIDVHQREAAVCGLHIQPSEANLQNQGRLQIRSESPTRSQVQVVCQSNVQ